MLNLASEILYASLVSRLGVDRAAAESALLATLEHFHIESHNPAVVRAGLSPADYMDTVMQTARFAATLSSAALMADGRDADARLNWKAYVQREIAVAERAQQAVPRPPSSATPPRSTASAADWASATSRPTGSCRASFSRSPPDTRTAAPTSVT